MTLKRRKDTAFDVWLTVHRNSVWISDVWLTVHRNSVWIKKIQLDVTFVFFISLLIVLNMFRATMCPSSGADDCVML